MVKLAVMLVVLFAFVANASSPWFKGWFGEAIMRLAMWLALDKKTYHVLNNVILPAGDGTTQIDHVIVSRFGIFVVEVKAMKGAIYGSEHDRNWTQAIGRQKYQFMNPLRQNYKHTMTLAEVIELPHEKMRSVIMLIGDAKLKTAEKLPPHVLTRGFVSFVKSHTQQLLTEEQVATALERIEQRRVVPSLAANQQHVRNVKNLVAGKQRAKAERTARTVAVPAKPVVAAPPPMPATPLPPPVQAPQSAVAVLSDASEPPVCPRCGKPMVIRTAAKGKNVGGHFWGCTGFPKCRGIVQAE